MSACEGLDELSRAFCRALFDAYPSWEPLAREVKDAQSGARWVEVVIPQEGSSRQLWLSTADREILVGFDCWHTHVGPFLGLNTAQSVAEALSMIESFVSERSVVWVRYCAGTWAASKLESLAAVPRAPEPGCAVQIYSWRRTHDQIIEAP